MADVGNTAIKVARVSHGALGLVQRVADSEALAEWLAKEQIARLTYCDVRRLLDSWQSTGVVTRPLRELGPFPVDLGAYPAGELGSDRLAAIIAAVRLFPGRSTMVIDAGSCITYEYIDAHGKYLGGNISPGLSMRYKAMATFTASLPEVSAPESWTSFGQNTQSALKNGGLFGYVSEVKAAIDYFCAHSPNSALVITGGDAPLLQGHLSELSLVHRPHLVLEGLVAADQH